MEYNAFDLTAKPPYKQTLFARIKNWFRMRKFIKERAQKGWSRYDAWDFNCYLAMVIADALEYLAGAHMSHPWDYTPEEWSEKLQYISECFKQYNKDEVCDSYEAWRESVVREEASNGCVVVSGGDEDLLRAWHEEERRNYEAKMKQLKEGFDLLYEVFPNLWD